MAHTNSISYYPVSVRNACYFSVAVYRTNYGYSCREVSIPSTYDEDTTPRRCVNTLCNIPGTRYQMCSMYQYDTVFVTTG